MDHLAICGSNVLKICDWLHLTLTHNPDNLSMFYGCKSNSAKLFFKLIFCHAVHVDMPCLLIFPFDWYTFSVNMPFPSNALSIDTPYPLILILLMQKSCSGPSLFLLVGLLHSFIYCNGHSLQLIYYICSLLKNQQYKLKNEYRNIVLISCSFVDFIKEIQNSLHWPLGTCLLICRNLQQLWWKILMPQRKRTA